VCDPYKVQITEVSYSFAFTPGYASNSCIERAARPQRAISQGVIGVQFTLRVERPFPATRFSSTD
jgi:hypothetical protein